MMSGKALSELYCHVNGLVVDIGGRNVNGSLRSFFEKKGMICMGKGRFFQFSGYRWTN